MSMDATLGRSAINTPLALACEFAKGNLALTLIKYMLSWYPTNELPLRFLLWSVFRAMFLNNKGSSGIGIYINVLTFVLNIMALIVLFSTDFMNLIGGPRDITWLSPHQKLYYSTRSAASELQPVTWKRVWRDRQQLVIKLIQPFSVFVISLLRSLSLTVPYKNAYIPYASEAGAVVFIVLAGLAVYKFPSKLFRTVAMCSILSGAATVIGTSSLGSHLPFPLHLIGQLHHVVPPLLWAMAVRETPAWAEALGTVSLSLIGTVIALFLSQVTVWAVLWARQQKLGGVRLPEDTQDSRTPLEVNHSESGIE
ncbi:uncharacterized protein LY79DRAFT_277026 [Colletotrichum navitas]|uniref:Uncharacterized protein n=1 Tax=Colletotrichum navitas TaxID=681940 RepID=A0AAD8V2T6_9PEZI|nr:uncharacterized protein LY79DRAFT_277026 [Colletotrichum navitas]KAK1585187.1 hypothetical protein LY79DRAFT_277026 [Colletotrichum navitas]